jgi:hypothetical protein
MLRRGFVGILITGLVAIVAGLIGYQAGLTSSAIGSGATVVVTGGFPGLGFLFFLFFIGFVFFAFAGRHRRAWSDGHGPFVGPMGPGGPGGPGSQGRFGGPGDPSDPRRQWVAEMHRSLHAADAGADRPADPTPTGATPPEAAPAV